MGSILLDFLQSSMTELAKLKPVKGFDGGLPELLPYVLPSAKGVCKIAVDTDYVVPTSKTRFGTD